MFRMSMQSNIAAATRDVTIMRDQIPVAAAKALTFTAQRVQYGERVEMQRVFDRPIPFTLSSLYLKPATLQNLEARVYFKGVWGATASDQPSGHHYLEPQVYGGDRPLKGGEKLLQEYGFLPPGMIAVPGERAKLDANGNMSKGQLMQIRSALQIAESRKGRTANRSAASIKRRGKALPNFIFIGQPHPGMPAGVWERVGNTGLRPILIFVKMARYKQRYDFYGVAQRISEQEFDRQLDIELGRMTPQSATSFVAPGME